MLWDPNPQLWVHSYSGQTAIDTVRRTSHRTAARLRRAARRHAPALAAASRSPYYPRQAAASRLQLAPHARQR